MRLPLDLSFVFTANPEDYTNRGSIITPLKDRIESQILTHYPSDLDIAKQITLQEAKLTSEQRASISIDALHHDLLERMVMKARESEYIDGKSGVSARVAISAYENLVSAIERRIILNGEKFGHSRLADFHGILPALTGKLELVYEGEQEGPVNVAWKLFEEALKEIFLIHFPHPDRNRRDKDIYGVLRAFFAGGNEVQISNDMSQSQFAKQLEEVAGLTKLVGEVVPNAKTLMFSKNWLYTAWQPSRLLAKVWVKARLTLLTHSAPCLTMMMKISRKMKTPESLKFLVSGLILLFICQNLRAQITVFEKPAGKGKTWICARNENNIPYTIILHLKLKNMKTATAMPSHFIVPASNTGFELIELVAGKGKYSYQIQYETFKGITTGHHHNDKYVYGLPVKGKCKIIQGYYGKFSHIDKKAIDFGLLHG